MKRRKAVGLPAGVDTTPLRITSQGAPITYAKHVGLDWPTQWEQARREQHAERLAWFRARGLVDDHGWIDYRRANELGLMPPPAILTGRKPVAHGTVRAYLFPHGRRTVDHMAGKKPPSGWRSEHVAAAIVAAVAAVLVAVIGLLGRGGDSEGTEPKISIGDFRFFPVSSGDIRIQVTGTVADFRAGDRLYAIAEPIPVEKKIWWVSQTVVPTLDGTWIALILAEAVPGQELRIYAVRVPAGADPSSSEPEPTSSATEPSETDGPTETDGSTETAEPSQTPSPPPPTTSGDNAVEPVDRTRAVLRARGPSGVAAADVISRAVTIPTPP